MKKPPRGTVASRERGLTTTASGRGYCTCGWSTTGLGNNRENIFSKFKFFPCCGHRLIPSGFSTRAKSASELLGQCHAILPGSVDGGINTFPNYRVIGSSSRRAGPGLRSHKVAASVNEASGRVQTEECLRPAESSAVGNWKIVISSL